LENILKIFHSNLDNNVETTPDVILLQEIARDCYRFGRYQNGIEEMAKSLGMYYAYAVEYIDLEHFYDGS